MKKGCIVIGLAVLLALCSCGSEPVTPTFDEALLVGEWIDSTLHEKYLPEGIGTTWDTYDDVTEEEADTFNWSFDGSRLIQEHHMVNAIVPRWLTVKKLDFDSLVYQDDGGILHHFHRNDTP